MAAVTREQIIEQLRTVMDPELGKDLVTLNMIKEVEFDGADITVGVELTTPACPLKDKIGGDVQAALKQIAGVNSVSINWSAQIRSARPDTRQLPGVKNVIAVGAGKGGVGKSTAAVLLAFGLQRSGAKVGLLDADVYGPSIPKMTGLEGAKPGVSNEMIVPPEAGGVKIISIGFMIEPDKPLIWRGPMVHGVVKQFLEQVEWGELDYLIVDLPPGTGDVPLTLAQAIPMTGAIVVCTPQDVAMADARRAVKMYEQLNVPTLGIIENMSYYLCPSCGHRDELFDHGGAKRSAEEMGIAFLGEIPLNATIRVHGDSGKPDQLFTETADYVQEAIHRVVSNAAGRISVQNQLQVAVPTLTIDS